eukprot:g7074.t1
MSIVAELRRLLFVGGLAGGSGARRARKPGFNVAWRRQNLGFRDARDAVPGLEYGLMQHEGGPCGVMAVVQAELVRELLWGDGSGGGDDGEVERLSAGGDALQGALLSAVARILTRAARGGSQAAAGSWRAALVLRSGRGGGGGGGCPLDGELFVTECDDEEYLRALLGRPSVARQLTQEGGGGAILLACSALLSRGLALVAADVAAGVGAVAGNEGAFPVPPLIDAHAYCSQELVSLLLLGRAVGQVFDGVRTLGGGGGAGGGGGGDGELRLVGVQERSDVGFLTLVEAYGHAEVGPCLKCPRYPVWVVCSESHYSVLFSVERARVGRAPVCGARGADTGAGGARFGGRFGSGMGMGMGMGMDAAGPFNIFYYDELANPGKVI